MTKLGMGMGRNRKQPVWNRMGMALIPIGINFHRWMPCMAYVLARKTRYCFLPKSNTIQRIFSVVCDVQ